MIRRLWLGLLAALAAAPAVAAERIHGADAHYASPVVALAWAVLRHRDEAETAVVIRVADRAGRGWHLQVDGVDPFGGARRTLATPQAVGGGVDVTIPRRVLADLPSLELHFAADDDALRAGDAVLTIYYLGVPDTTPEFPDAAKMDDYLARTIAGR
ncbi:MAG: hypothetical protein IT561_19920 [Alphaproteobacteria bacterium]|nr:hypothetical protein [Alphaproteobacteria bacterium]